MTVSGLQNLQQEQGAIFAAGSAVPEHFGAPAAEYQAAHEAVVLADRSDAGRLLLTDRDRLAILHRISTNAVENLPPGAGEATILLTPLARIIDRIIVHQIDEQETLARTSAGRGDLIARYLRRNIFFRDRMQVRDVTADLAQFVLYGPAAGAVAGIFVPGVSDLPLHGIVAGTFEGDRVLGVVLDRPGVPGIGLIIAREKAAALWRAVFEAGQEHGLRPAGLAVCDILRVEAGLPGPAELNEEYIPLEAGLWSDVSFNKGCYTGQEIIARMESRGKLARMLVGLSLPGAVAAGEALTLDGRERGTLTSAAMLPGGTWIGLGFVRTDMAEIGRQLFLADGRAVAVRLISGHA